MENQLNESYRDRRLSQILRAYAWRHAATAPLRRRIAASLLESAAARPSAMVAIFNRIGDWIVPVTAGFSAASALSVAVLYYQAKLGDDEALGQQLVSAQVRSTMPETRFNASASPAEIRSWLGGRLPFSPSIAELAQDGYRLAGSRIEQISGRSVATLRYFRGPHMVNVLACPLRGGGNARAFGQGRYHIIGWTDSQVQYWAVSDLDAAELARFAVSYQRATGNM